MRNTTATITITVLCLLVLAAVCAADGPVVSNEGKLWGLTYVTGGPEGDDQGPDMDVIYPLYESSKANLAFVGVDWGNCETADPGTGASKYDWSSFDKQVFMKSSKTKICWIGLGNAWADRIKDKDPERYWKLAEAFVTEFVKHANRMGIRYFQVPGNEYNLLGRADWAELYVEPLKHIYKAAKAVSDANIIIAGNLSYGGDEVVQELYDAGFKGNFDVLDIHAYSNDPRTGIDIFQVIEAHRAMARNGDGDKKIFLGEGWGPMRELPNVQRASHNDAPSQAEIDSLRWFVENGYRNMMTERDIYDPNWILGARFFTMNDNYGQGKWEGRAQKIDENNDGSIDYILLDGYKFPADFNIKPKFFNGGLVDFTGKPKEDLLDNFPPEIPNVTVDATLTGDGPIFNYVTNKAYKLELKVTNSTGEEITLNASGVRWHPKKGISIEVQTGGKLSDGITLDVQTDGRLPETLAAGGSATCVHTVTFPKEAANRQITLIGEIEYTLKGRKHIADCWTTVMVTPQFEITLLPARAVLDPAENPMRVGMSVINHSDQAFEGKIKLSPSPMIEVKPAELDVKIDPHGLEAGVFTVTADAKAAPGHYAVFIEVGDKVKDWVAVEVPVLAKKAKSVKVDGKLDEWADAATFSIARANTEADGKISYDIIGKGKFAYDDAGFYTAFEIDDATHVQERGVWDLWQQDSIQIAFDPLIDGARVASGGYKPDDYEYGFAQTKSGAIVGRSQAPEGKPTGAINDVKFAFTREGNKSFYEMAFPWSELAPFEFGKGKSFAVSVLVNNSDGGSRSYVEWGGGIGEGKDPRKFIPVFLVE